MASLNPEQQAAVSHNHGPLLVLAGAGSGKTRVIAHRIAELVRNGVRAKAILAVSFTNKSAAEMQSRVSRLMDSSAASQVWLSTFHSFGVRFLSEEHATLGWGPQFAIMDQGDSYGLLRELLRRGHYQADGKRLDVPALSARISLWKNKGYTLEQVPDSDFEYDAVAKELYPRYQQALEQMHAVDFDDLVLKPVQILENNEAIRTKWQQRFRYILIDEFQDTNAMQMRLVRVLVNELQNICVVGDDDQSIYSWRGADITNILEFERYFPRTQIVKLEKNYRSTDAVVQVANSVIAQAASKRHLKVLRSQRGGGEKVSVCELQSPEHEAQFVVSQLRRVRDDGCPLDEIAVLYRSNGQARLLEEELRAHNIEYQVSGGQQFFDAKEIKDALAYLRLLAHPRDELSFRRIIHVPPRGVGEGSLEKLEAWAKSQHLTLVEAAERCEITELPAAAKAGLRQLNEALVECRQMAANPARLRDAAEQLWQRVGLFRDIEERSGSAKVALRRKENLNFLLQSLERFSGTAVAQNGPLASLNAFLNRIMLRSEGEKTDGKGVTLCTLHAAKGLEFRTVFLIGCVEGQIPHSRVIDPRITEIDSAGIEEERRLFYVGVTRACDRLFLTRYSKQSVRGRVSAVTPSRFLDGLSEAHIEFTTPVYKQALDSNEIAAMSRDLVAFLENRA